MDYICFLSKEKALIHRSKNGGWIAIDADGYYFWFNLSYRLSDICTHKALSGCNAKFI
jgi:hypothetical protein